MPYPKLKKETYHCQGGLNTKVSLYITGEGEWLGLRNVCFQTVGALSSFNGSTVLTAANSSTSSINGFGEYQNAAGTSLAVVATDAYNVSDVSGGTFRALMPLIYGGHTTPMSSVFGGTALYGCNGRDFWSYFGSTLAWQFSLGKPLVPISNAFSTFGQWATFGAGTGGLSGTLVMYYSVFRSDGLVGPALAVTYSLIGATGISVPKPIGPNTLIGNTYGGISLGSFGCSGVVAWAQLNGGLPLGFGTSTAFGVSLSPFGATTGGTGVINLPFDWTAAGWWVTDPQPYDYQGSFAYEGWVAPGFPLRNAQGGGLFSWNTPPTGPAGGAAPKIIALYANQLFTANHHNNTSRVIYSNPGTPEIADYANYFDVGMSDPSGVSAMQDFFTQLMIWKPRSTWALSGTGPDTFVLTQVSSIYGCLSKNSKVVWNQNCWFLDEKGIFEFNGANVQCVSNKVDDIFRAMNVAVAAEKACMLHIKERNEIWCLIPSTPTSSANDLIVVYDYLANAWTTRSIPAGGQIGVGDETTVMQALYNGASTGNVFFGTDTGNVGNYGPSLIGDVKVTQECTVFSRYIEGDLGNSVTKTFRRLYIDATIPPGSTYAVGIELYPDKGFSAAHKVTMMLSAFQNRIDFGVTAKSLAVRIDYLGDQFFQLNGFTIEYRFARAT